ncbi:LysM peptidoglycan-binding domain-containing protein [uncultured Jatrophihabitans sp.]|uniref:LysM peptidoglycan-binding domain-containing protein n=1 Tax=uncultured Jatrophihabitans sp. TaxID=1610747 RepID=UPI0035CC936A
MGSHNSARITRRATPLALLIGGLILAGGLALVIALTTGGSTGTTHRTSRAAADLTVPSSSTSGASSSTSGASSSASSTPTTPAALPTAPAAHTAPRSSAKPQAKTKTMTYTVKRGDNLTAIARWFHLHGYQPLYAWNKTVIGKNPDLIFAGQKITVSTSGGVKVSG